MRALLRSPAGGSMRQFMVLRFYGRKSGRRYDIPVVAHHQGEQLYALTDARWRHNFRGGADVEVTLDGRATEMRGELIEDTAALASVYAHAIDQYGIKGSKRMLGLKILTPSPPSAEALSDAVRRYHLVAIELTAKA
jgi:hypothetical protein